MASLRADFLSVRDLFNVYFVLFHGPEFLHFGLLVNIDLKVPCEFCVEMTN